MIRVTIELLPLGEDRGRENEVLGVMLIANDLTKTFASKGRRANYFIKLWKKRHAGIVHRHYPFLPAPADPWATTEVRDFPRLSQHPWNIVREALNTLAKQKGGRI